MKLEVTRDVVSDLWPLYRAGEASAETSALMSNYLAGDPELAAELERNQAMNVMPPITLSPEAERRMLDDARSRANHRLLLIGGAIAVVAFLSLAGIVALFFLGAV